MINDTEIEERASGSTVTQWISRVGQLLGLGRAGSTREMLADALKEDSAARSGFSAQERDMLVRLLHFSASRVEDIMVPRADVIAVDERNTLGDLLAKFRTGGISRIPLYRDTLDNPDGMVHIKDLFVWLLNKGGHSEKQDQVANGEANPDEAFKNLDLSSVDMSRSIAGLKLRRPILYVPLSMPAMNLLIRMQSTRIHMALVVDEYGGTDGLVTIEDLVEQIVGDIEDEHDEAEEIYITVDKANNLIASARTPVEDLEQHLGTEILTDEEEEEIDTLGGLVFTLVGRVPARGEIVKHGSGLEFEVLDADPRRVKKLKIYKTNLNPHQSKSDTNKNIPADSRA